MILKDLRLDVMELKVDVPSFYFFKSFLFSLGKVISLTLNDNYYYHNLQETLLRICCAMLIIVRRRLLAGDFTSNLKLLQNYPSPNISHLLYVANKLRVKSPGLNF